MRLLTLASVFSAGAVALGFGYYRGHQSAAEAENLRLLEPIVGELLDSPVTTEVGDVTEGGNTAEGMLRFRPSPFGPRSL